MAAPERPKVGLPKTALGPHAVAHWAAVQPDQTAVRHADGPELTYTQLDDLARRFAGALGDLGIEPGTHVATFLDNGFDAQGLWLGLGWLRAVEVPLNLGLNGALLTHALVASDSVVLITTPDLLPRIREIQDALPALERILLLGDSDGAGMRQPVTPLRALVDGAKPADLPGPVYRDICSIMFTSGTTGPAKPVLVPWPLVYHMWSWTPDDAIAPGEFAYSAMAMFHNSGRSALNGCLVRGGAYVFREKFSGSKFWDDVRTHQCVLASLVGPMLAMIHTLPPRDDDADNPLRAVLCGPMIRDIEDFEKRFGVKTATGYGQTEVGMAVVTDWNHGPWQNCGRARPHYPWTEVRVVDENEEPLAAGEVGELVVRTAEPWALNAGYYKLPEATADAWRNGWFHTGDAFRYDEEGWFYLVDRMKDAIRRRGENISSFEVETLVSPHPEVIECAAVAAPAEFGEDEVRIVLIVRDPAKFDPAELLSWLEPRMPRYMLPRYVDVVDDLPRNATTGRIKKHELRAVGIGPNTWDREATDG